MWWRGWLGQKSGAVDYVIVALDSQGPIAQFGPTTTTMIPRLAFLTIALIPLCNALSVSRSLPIPELGYTHNDLQSYSQQSLGKPPHPLVLWHGLGDSAHVCLKAFKTVTINLTTSSYRSSLLGFPSFLSLSKKCTPGFLFTLSHCRTTKTPTKRPAGSVINNPSLIVSKIA